MYDMIMKLNSKQNGWNVRPLTDKAVWFLEMQGVLVQGEMYTEVGVPDSVISNARMIGLVIRGIV